MYHQAKPIKSRNGTGQGRDHCCKCFFCFWSVPSCFTVMSQLFLLPPDQGEPIVGTEPSVVARVFFFFVLLGGTGDGGGACMGDSTNQRQWV